MVRATQRCRWNYRDGARASPRGDCGESGRGAEWLPAFFAVLPALSEIIRRELLRMHGWREHPPALEHAASLLLCVSF